jgi:hypothetical protein
MGPGASIFLHALLTQVSANGRLSIVNGDWLMEINEKFASLDEWTAWSANNRFVYDPVSIETFGKKLLTEGFHDPFTDEHIDWDSVKFLPPYWQQSVHARGIVSRVRATMLLLRDQLREMGVDQHKAKIYGAEAVTHFALRMRGIFPRYIGSEFIPEKKDQDEMFPIEHQDLLSLTFPENVFDMVTTNEVLEHVPDLDKALSEIARVLRPGGWHIGTHPFRLLDRESDLRAIIKDGELKYLKDPVYHGNPIDPNGGSLVFEMPGWDIVRRAEAAGFASVHMRFLASTRYGIIGDNTGVFVLCAQK